MFGVNVDSIPLYYGNTGIVVASTNFFYFPVVSNKEYNNGIFVEKKEFFKETICNTSFDGEYILFEKNQNRFFGCAIDIERIWKYNDNNFRLFSTLTFGYFPKKHFINKYKILSHSYPCEINIQNSPNWQVSFDGLSDFYWEYNFGAILFFLDNITRRLSYIVSDEHYAFIGTPLFPIPQKIKHRLINNPYLLDEKPILNFFLEKEY